MLRAIVFERPGAITLKSIGNHFDRPVSIAVTGQRQWLESPNVMALKPGVKALQGQEVKFKGAQA